MVTYTTSANLFHPTRACDAQRGHATGRGQCRHALSAHARWSSCASTSRVEIDRSRRREVLESGKRSERAVAGSQVEAVPGNANSSSSPSSRSALLLDRVPAVQTRKRRRSASLWRGFRSSRLDMVWSAVRRAAPSGNDPGVQIRRITSRRRPLRSRPAVERILARNRRTHSPRRCSPAVDPPGAE